MKSCSRICKQVRISDTSEGGVVAKIHKDLDAYDLGCEAQLIQILPLCVIQMLWRRYLCGRKMRLRRGSNGYINCALGR